jgi:hypothetical protein
MKQKTTEFLEIVEKIPNRILLIITFLAAFVFCSLIFFTVNLSYPDVISGEVVSNIFLTKVHNSDETYTLLQVELKNQGKTDTNKSIKFVNGMTAQIDVVVERMTFAQRLFNRINRLRKE